MIDTDDVQEAVVVLWVPMLKSLPTFDHKCPCYPEQGLCPCPDFINHLECKCGMFILKEVFMKKRGKIERVKVR